MTQYKIRHTKTGLFSTGGEFPRWSSKGKTWSMGALKNHLNFLNGSHGSANAVYSEAELVEVEHLVTKTKTSLNFLIKHLLSQLIEKESKRMAASKRAAREAKERQYEQLKKELGK